MEDVSYAQKKALGDKFSSLETNVLVAMWGNEQRMPWADSLLRSELRKRGIDAHELNEIQASRPADPVYASSADDKISARFLAFGTAIITGLVSAVLFGREIGLLVAAIVIAIYVAYLWFSLLPTVRSDHGLISTASLVYDALKFSALAGVMLYVAIAQLLARA
jgi:hypothetical protein